MGDKKVFELGRYYIHNTGELLFICAIADSRMYGRTLIGETESGNFIPIGSDHASFENWREITRDEFISEQEKKL